MNFLSIGGRTTEGIKSHDMKEIRRNSPHVVILMVGGNDLCNTATSALKMASDIHDLALSFSGMEGCHMVFVASIPPRTSYPDMCPGYLDRIKHCNLILRNLLEVENEISVWAGDKGVSL